MSDRAGVAPPTGDASARDGAGVDTAGATPSGTDAELARLGTSRDGRPDAEARRRLEQLGPNATAEERRSALAELAAFFWGPIPWMIEVADLLSIILRPSCGTWRTWPS